MDHEEKRSRKSRDEKRQIREYFKNKEGGVFVEVGANEPVDNQSQSWHLEDLLGWSGVLVEPNSQLAEKAKQARPKSKVYQCACTSPDQVGPLTLYIPIKGDREISGHASVEVNADDYNYSKHNKISVEAKTLDHILEESSITEIDLLSLDVEGTEMDVLSGFDITKYRPRLILLEDKFLYLEKHHYLKKHGYKLVKRTKQNNWYVQAEAPRPKQSTKEKIRLFKKMYLIIWFRKIQFAIKSKRLKPLLRL